MASGNAQNARLRRLRARYRKKMTVTAIVTLLVGLVLGFAICVLSLNHVGWMSRLFRLGPVEPADASVPGLVENTPTPTPTPEIESTPLPTTVPQDEQEQPGLSFAQPEGEAQSIEPTAEPTEASQADADVLPESDDGESGSMITALTVQPPSEATPEPVAEATAEPTAEATAEPTAEPTAEATAEPTVEPTVEATAEPTAEPTAAPTEEPTPEPTAEPTEAPTPEPTPASTPAPVIVPYGQPYSIQTEIDVDGGARESVEEAPYELLDVTVKVDGHRGPDYFQEQYVTKYKLQGNEAVVQLDVTVNGYTGTTQLIPQNFMAVKLIGATPDVVNEGYQLMDAEIGGKPDVVVTPGVATPLYKRYVYSAEQGEMTYMVISAWLNGERRDVWFEIVEPEPEETATPEPGEEGGEQVGDGDSLPAGSLAVGSEGDEVKRLQRALIKEGVLSGSPDGKYGNYTAEAVRIMQKRYGMEQTGIADPDFQVKLYGGE